MAQLNVTISKMHARGGVAPSHHLLLVRLNDLTISTAQQLCRATRSPSALTRTRTLLKELFEDGLVSRQFLPRISPTGGSTYVYFLSPKGARYLQELQIEVRGKRQTLDYYRLLHTFSLNDFLLLAFELDRLDPRFELRRWYHDYDLKKMLKGAPVPDAWVELVIGGTQSRCIALELDRGTMDEKQMRSKVSSYVEWVGGRYQAAFGVTSLTVCLVAPTQKRTQLLKRWIESELTAKNRLDLAPLFHLGSFDLAQATPAEVFLSASYLVPFAQEEVSLL